MTCSERAVRVLLDGLVHVLVAAETLVDAVLLRHDLAGTLRVELVRCLGVQPGNGAAEAEALRGDDADMARGRRPGT